MDARCDRYSSRKLSYSGDRLVALSATAKVFQPHNQCQYLAGLWSCKYLPRLLLWSTTFSGFQEYRGYIAPSWSWASSGGVYYDDEYAKDLRLSKGGCYNAVITNTDCVPEHIELPLGRVLCASLTIVANVRRGVCLPHNQIHMDAFKWVDGQTDQQSLNDRINRQYRNPMMVAVLQYDIWDGEESEIDGLIVAWAADGKFSRRIGTLVRAAAEYFQEAERREVTLI